MGESMTDPWSGEGGGAGAWRDSGGGLKDRPLFSLMKRLIPKERGLK